ncbi:MAG: hypothetical protein RIC80_17720 [Cyclobacteriaceae bacterium]
MRPVSFLIYLLGAVTLWAISGFKGEMQSHMPRPLETSPKEKKALAVGIIVLLSLFFITLKIAVVLKDLDSSPSDKILIISPQDVEKLEKKLEKIKTQK